MDAFFSLFVPLAVIALVLLSKRIVLSLFVGIVLAGIVIHYKEPLDIFSYIYEKISSVFYEYSSEKGLSANWDGIYVFLFLLSLGVLSQVVLVSGGVSAFVKWARNKVKDTRTSEFVAFFAGIVIFIDDYFNALTVGQIAKPLNMAYKSSRERLAYIIDSTSAPICVLVPISSWGAYIIGILQSSLPKDQNDPLFVLFGSIGGNFYAWFALITVFLVILWQINLPAMRKNVNVSVSTEQQEEYSASNVFLLLMPIVALILSIAFMIFYTGYKTSNSLEIIKMLEECDTPFSLFCGGAFALLLSLCISSKYIAPNQCAGIISRGVRLMLPAIVILVLAWAISPVIREDLKTGLYLANFAKESLSSQAFLFLPFFLFLISAFISFSTGTSWGCFAIMIPIAIELSLQSNGNMVIAISAVLSGAVYGDHTSPMSDTTILSSIGAGCSLRSHFVTQLPYAGISACFAGMSFLSFAFTQNIAVSFVVCAMGLIGTLWVLKRKYGGELQGV